MIEHEYKFRVTYPDTDKMGTMHHANYVKYYEAARWELLRSIGVPYTTIEDAGVMCPVIRMNFKFIKSTRYDELLTVKTTLKAMKGVRMWFTYHLYNEKNEPSGINYSSGKMIRMFFMDGKLDRVKVTGNVEGKQYPDSYRGNSKINLRKFVWREREKPF